MFRGKVLKFKKIIIIQKKREEKLLEMKNLVHINIYYCDKIGRIKKVFYVI
ncbi:hypothetical protein KN1_27690 [Stygiolobus caldivivus]|uniref:Uncharacterized protein n=1 Tax=Stygiolobus caldivivus TaxID=2824673 RepID=A0A8D5U920_9CREN|nr:hypothetical protein KN1_27690 [Stygiolobus caldivivus]